MILGNQVFAVIPARGGSKGVPQKNIKNFAGKPLIAWTIETAQKTSEIDRTIVSTNCMKTAVISERYGAEIVERPLSLALDHSPAVDVVRDILQQIGTVSKNNTIIVYLQPTSPLRAVQDIQSCLDLLDRHAYDSVATFKKSATHPCQIWEITNTEPKLFLRNANPWQPRQAFSPLYQLNGAVYAFYASSITERSISLLNGRVGAVVMPKERSVDIDDSLDFLLAVTLIKNKLIKVE